MNCQEASQGILQANLPELEGVGESSLAAHIRRCDRCRAAAQAIVEDHTLLPQVLHAVVPEPDLDGILDRHLAEKKAISEGAQTRAATHFKRVGLYLLPLAAAATLAGLFFGGNPSLPGEPYTVPQPAQGLGLEVADGRDVAVLATDNPDITVLWFF